MCSVERARNAETEKSAAEDDWALAGGRGEERLGDEGEGFLGRDEARKESTEAMVKKRRGAAEDEVESSEVGEPADPGEVADAVVAAVAEEDEEVESVEERNEVVGSREFCRCSRFDSINKND